MIARICSLCLVLLRTVSCAPNACCRCCVQTAQLLCALGERNVFLCACLCFAHLQEAINLVDVSVNLVIQNEGDQQRFNLSL